jgi:hypothetical protein
MWVRREGWRRWPASPARPSSRGIFRVAAVATVVAAVGVTAGSAAAVGQQAVKVTLAYSCSFSSGSQPVSAQVTATFPDTATTGQPVKPTGTGITVTLRHAAAGDLARLHAATVTLTAGLATQITEGTKAATAVWRNFRSPAAAVPATGPLTLTASGTAAPVTASTPGEATVAAGGLALLFAGQTADHRPARTSSLRVACAPKAGQDTTLAKIAVHGSAPPASSVTPGDDPAKCLPYPKHLKLNPLFPLPKPLPGSTAIRQPSVACSYATGYTNAERLNEAVLVGPGLTDLKLGIPTFDKFTKKYFYLYQRVAAQLEYHGRPELPPVKATLLGFGFMPVSARLQVSEIGSLNVALISCGDASNPTQSKDCPNPPPKNVALLFGLVTLRISDVSVNGVPLNVGPHCQTAKPFDLELTGVPPAYHINALNGVLTGSLTVPDFTGCGVGEDLDPLFNATVSGPGNFVKVNQAVYCSPNVPPPNECPPAKPPPKH